MKCILTLPAQKGILFFFLFFSILISPVAAQLDKMSIVGKPQKAPDEIVTKCDANGRFCAGIKVISDMDGFKYDAYNGVVSMDDQPGQDMVYLQPDERVLEIFKSGYKPLKIILSEVGIQLRPREVWKIEIKGGAKTGDLLPVTFLVQPADAKITVDGKNVQSGKPLELSKGSHRLRISKEGYRSLEKEITVSKDKVLFNETLCEVELQQVVIKSIPTGARIYLDNVEKGLTDKGLFLYPGQYQLKISKTGYMDIKETIDINESENNAFTYTLLKNSGSMSLNITPSGARILINKEDYSNLSNIELAPGRYKIEISKTGYHPQSETVTIERGRPLNKSYTLIAKTGKLQFNIQPLTAKVTLKQKGRAVQSWTGMKYIKDLQVGSYELQCTAPGFQTIKQALNINENQMTSLDLRMKKSYDNMVTDIDGNVYKTVKIGSQIWMAENLKVTRYRNGDRIPNVTGNSEWANINTGAYCNYDNNSSNVSTYGRLYNWYTLNDSRNIAPVGWHVPTDAEWKQLEMYLGMSQSKANETGWRGSDEGGKLKERGTSHWKSPNKGATNSSGFTALPGGYRLHYGAFVGIGFEADYWSATVRISSIAWTRRLGCNHSAVARYVSYKQSGFSVRCVRD